MADLPERPGGRRVGVAWRPRWAANERVAQSLTGDTVPPSVPQFPHVPRAQEADGGGGAGRQVSAAPGDAGEQAGRGR